MSCFPAAQSLLENAIRDHAFPGAAWGVLLDGQVLAVQSAGRFTYQPDSSAVQPETIFDIASITKVLAATAMAMRLYDQNRLELDVPIAATLPEFVADAPKSSPRHAITARMLLAHTSGLPAYARLFEHCRTAPKLLQAALQMPLENPPGRKTVYSDIGFIVLGQLLETIAGEAIGRYCRREIFQPLQMNSTGYLPPAALHSAIPPTAERDTLRSSLVQGEVNDENCWAMGGVSGHAGVFSNVADTLRFANCILRQGGPLFSPETVAMFTTRVSDSPQARALGWDVPTPPSSSGKFFSRNSVGHLGYTGTSLWIDLDKSVAVVLLTNRTFPGKETDGFNRIQQVRPQFHDAVLAELGFARSPA
jgi:CubicO group peptidase (beta-lactamase class C family)